MLDVVGKSQQDPTLFLLIRMSICCDEIEDLKP